MFNLELSPEGSFYFENMGIPKSNGLVEIAGTKIKERGFFCMKLAQFIGEDAEFATQEYAALWDKAFSAAKRGVCFYKARCSIYSRTKKRTPIQLKLFTNT